MTQLDVNDAAPRDLSTLIADDAASHPIWRPDELGDLLRFQLAAPLEGDLVEVRPSAAETLTKMQLESTEPPQTFAELLLHESPPLELLAQLKDFCKSLRASPNSGLPEEIAVVIYFAALAAAMQKHGERISSLRDEETKVGIQWALSRSWLDTSLRPLLEGGLAALDGR
jgi:hypothetical protein